MTHPGESPPRWRKRAARNLFSAWTWLAVACAVLVLLVFWFYVPLNMDEFVSYQTLACFAHPHSVENVFCSSCASFYLRVLGRFDLPLLTYDYIGSLSSLLYAPLFFAWPSPASARLLGMIALFVQSLLLARLFRFRTAVVFCCLVFFVPYSFVHIADTGPVAFQTTSVFLVCYLLRRWQLSRDGRRRTAMMIVAGLAIALGCWVKPTYFFVSTGLAITAAAGFVLALLRPRAARARRTAEYFLLLVCAAIPSLLIYEARHPDGSAYLPVLGTSYLPDQIALAGLVSRLRENVLHFLVNPLDAAGLHFDTTPTLPATSVVLGLLAVFLATSGIFLRGIPPRHRREMALNAALFGLALLLVATNIYAKSMHHTVLAYPFILLAAARGIQLQRHRVFIRAALVLFVVLNASLLLRFPAMMDDARRTGNPKAFVTALNDDLNAHDAPDAVIACVDWGIYFVKSLYGPRSQVVLFLCSPNDDQPLQDAAAIARRLHRDLTVVGLRDNRPVRERLHAAAPTLRDRAAGGAGSPWEIWRIPAARLDALAVSVAVHSSLRPSNPPQP